MRISIIKIFFLIVVLLQPIFSNEFKLEKIEPPNWWTSMKCNQIQLMLYGKNLNNITAEFNTDKIEIKTIHEIENNSYAFIDVNIQQGCKAGEYILTVQNGENKSQMLFPVFNRIKNDKRYQGFDSQDIIYLITPDRFVNGDVTNDNIEGMRDHTDRSDILRRHGGDIQGMINKLDYIKELGFTAIWINPLIENDMDISYHGYAATDLHKIDPRFGTNDLYKNLVEKAHSMGLKIIMDHVSNHVGMYHPWVKNPPTNDWFHGTMENYDFAKHDKSVLIDSHADSSLSKNMKNGWFVTEMPDMNQSNPFLGKYLIQNTIWWIESTGIDGIREDTYPYVDQQFLSDWAEAIFDEYPKFNIVGEIWIGDPVFIAPFQKDSPVAINKKTYISSITDFALMESIGKIIGEDESIYNLYRCLSKDYLYKDPNMLVTFLDNHDVTRLWDLVDGDVERYKIALVLLMTLRGIPQIYYGTEIGLPGGDDHGLIRRDMPGGFLGNEKNVFTGTKLDSQERSIYIFLKNLVYLRKNSKAIMLGELTHFPPEDELYCYVRQYKNEKIVVVISNNNSEKILDLNEYNLSVDKKSGFEILLKNKTTKIHKKQYIELGKNGFAVLKIMQ